jgi:hypothetical protein
MSSDRRPTDRQLIEMYQGRLLALEYQLAVMRRRIEFANVLLEPFGYQINANPWAESAVLGGPVSEVERI